jgi:prevent-host-death family protein
MPDEYSIYDAKAHLSSLVKQVREGRTFVITVRGEAVAELRPITPPDAGPRSLEDRVADLTAKGEITPSRRRPGAPVEFPPGVDVPGALQRFLDDRE